MSNTNKISKFKNEVLLINTLLRETVTGENVHIDSHTNADADIIVRIVCSQGISLSVYPSLANHEGALFRNIEQKLQSRYYIDLSQTIQQQYEGEAVLSALESAKLDHIALKGWVMKRLYPSPEFRNMADLDILVRNHSFTSISDVMNYIGYTSPKTESAWMHDSFTKDSINVEMHKRLTDDSGVIQAWEQRMWAHTGLAEGTSHEYMMAWEDYFIFHMVHMHKDFKDGHLGLRRLFDMWLLLDRFETHMNSRYLESMWEFVNRMKTLAYACFETHEFNADSETLLDFAITSGIYGTGKTYRVSRMLRGGASTSTTGKIYSLITSVFLPFSRMKAQYPILKKYPFILPLMWTKRVLHYLKDAKKWAPKLNYNNVSDDDFRHMQKVFKAGGLK